MDYFDGSFRQRQSLVNLSTDNLTLVGETLYDYEGRKSVTALAVPSTDASLSYKSGFHVFQPQTSAVTANVSAIRKKYNYDNYREEGSVLSNQVGAGKYYSAVNASNSIHKSYIPDGEGFVYNQVEYMRDGTERTTRQSAVGKEFRIDGQHATRYFYGSAAPAELIRLFGTNAGIASHYKKNLVVDANGQVNVSYADQSDRVVATALAGDKPANVEGLDSYTNLPTAPTTVDVSQNNTRSNGVSQLSHKILNVAPGTNYTFNYDVSALGAMLGSQGCQSCNYDFSIVVTDPDGIALDLSAVAGNESTNPRRYERKNISASDCTTPGQQNVNFTLTLAEIGDYTVTKTLVPRELSYTELYNIVNFEDDVLIKIGDIYNSYVVDPSDCDICTSCPEGEAAIDQAIEEIADLDCENVYQQILQYYRDKYGDASEDPYEVPQDSITAHPLYCQYELCKQNKESDIFEKQIARVNDWPTAVGKGYNALINLDPFFNTAGLSGDGYKPSMQK